MAAASTATSSTAAPARRWRIPQFACCPKDSGPKLTVRYYEIAGLAFTGRDPALRKSWEAWVKNYWEKKRAGEKNIELKPEKLDGVQDGPDQEREISVCPPILAELVPSGNGSVLA